MEGGTEAILALVLLVDKDPGQDGVGTIALMYSTKSLATLGIHLC